MNDEQILIQRTQQGSHAAFKRLYELHVTPLFRFMRQFDRDSDQIEEWVQRAFIKAYTNIRQFEGTGKFSSWLFRLALNEMKMDRRSAAIIPLETVFDEDYSPEYDTNEYDHFEWHDLMKSWLSSLSDTKRMVFILYEVEGYSHAEIARMLGVGESTSRTILTRTKQFLQTQWKKANEF
ncbi:MAG: RNA polymerase sigma factor [Ignavibacteria bacterium]|nr:RNA polymerase sigma factor [Ignavibacteria bacterium]